MKKALMVTFIVFGIAVSVASADQESHRLATLKLLEVTNAQKMLDHLTTSIKTVMEQQFASLDLTPEGQEVMQEVKEELMTWFSGFFVWEQIRDLYIDIYIEVFTEEEINELVAFYQTPLGQKLLAKMPVLMQVSMQRTQAIMQKRMPEFQRRLLKSIAELKRKYKKV